MMAAKTGIILANLGSPDSATPESVRKYLGEFLHDYRVIDTSRWIWCPILHGVILRVRPARSARAYQKIWNWGGGQDSDEAPLVRITRQQGDALQARLGADVPVEIAMRYGNPSIDHALEKLKFRGCTDIGVLPLYPQFAGATTASVYDGVAKAIKTKADIPAISFIRDYHEHPLYISALANSITRHLSTLDWTPDVILASFHGLPQTYVDKGDPYQTECIRTVEHLRASLSMDDNQLRTTFQSRFGPKAWLQPYTDKTLMALAEKGVENVAVVTPGFSADCLETLEEIDMEARETFLEHGGKNFTTIPCLNSDSDHIDLIEDLVRDKLL